jgi:hypothetical protein
VSGTACRSYTRRVVPSRLATLLLAATVITSAASATPPKPKDHVPPKTPTGLTASATTSSVTLSWQASKDNKAVAGYGVYEDGVLIAQTPSTSYVVNGVPCGTTHQFGVDAFDSTGNRSDQATVTVTTPDCEGGGLTVYVSTTGLDGGLCIKAAPCKTFDYAYHVATPGATIEIAGGTYPAQTVNVDLTKLDAPSDVVFQPAAGATVQIYGDLWMYGSHAIFRNLKLHKLVSQGLPAPFTSHDVVFENLDGETFNIGPNYRITIKGGDWGPSLACRARDSAYDPSTWCPVDSPYASTGNDGIAAGDYENHIGPDGDIMNQWPHEITIDGARIHDQNSTDLEAMHTGGLFVISGYDIAIRNTIFQKDAVYDLQVQDFSTPDCCGMTFGPPHDVVVENNWFGAPVQGVNDPGGTINDEQPEVQLDPRHGACWSNWLIRYNSFYNGLALGLDADPCFSNVRVVGNVGETPGPQCFTGYAGLTWEYNAWLGGTCDPTDVTIKSLPYVSTTIGGENYHLTGGPAVNLVPGANADQQLGRDIDGQSRPLGAAWDAGSDELR